ncbi:hypothetical protein JNUCC0626_16255 [Lentzea sp. JNUCC 0626]|uniref:hypothetical protein n=1 Tax=Lentzea sp. JNUCC 0626 TaxID=3367513 RepID=UPI00374A93E7
MRTTLRRGIPALAALFGALALVLGLSGTASASTEFWAPSIPWTTATSPSQPWTNSKNICFGGGHCGGAGNNVIVRTPAAYISSVHMNLHDNVSSVKQGTIYVFVDDVLVGSADVKAASSIHDFAVNRVGSTIRLSPAPNPGAWSDEIVLLGMLIQ